MRRFRTYLISIIGGIAGAMTVLGISARIASRHAEEFIQRMRNAPPSLPPVPPDFQGGYVWGSVHDFGPGLFTWYLVVMVFAAIFCLLLRWQRRSLE